MRVLRRSDCVVRALAGVGQVVGLSFLALGLVMWLGYGEVAPIGVWCYGLVWAASLACDA